MYCGVLPLDESDSAFFAAMEARYGCDDDTHDDTHARIVRLARNAARRSAYKVHEAACKAREAAARKARKAAHALREVVRLHELELAREAAQLELAAAHKALDEVRDILRRNHKAESHPTRKILRDQEKAWMEILVHRS